MVLYKIQALDVGNLSFLQQKPYDGGASAVHVRVVLFAKVSASGFRVVHGTGEGEVHQHFALVKTVHVLENQVETATLKAETGIIDIEVTVFAECGNVKHTVFQTQFVEHLHVFWMFVLYKFIVVFGNEYIAYANGGCASICTQCIAVRQT